MIYKRIFYISTLAILAFYVCTFDFLITIPLVLINISFILVSMLRDR